MPPASSNKARPTFLSKWSGYALALGGAFLFATKGIFIKLAYEYGVDATTLLTLRLIIATPFFIAVGLITRYRQRHAEPLSGALYLKALAVGALGYWFASYTDFEGLVHLSPQFERLILFTYPLFVILLGAWLFRQPLKVPALPAFIIAYAGLALVFWSEAGNGGPDVAVGAAWVTASSVAFALYLLLAKPLIARMGAALFTSVAMVGAAIATFIHFGVTHPMSAIPADPGLWTLAIGLAIGATVLPGYLVSFALARISSQANAVIGFINPIFTMGLSVLILKEEISAIDLIGTLLVLGGVGLYTWLEQRPQMINKPDVSSAG
ncbi:DMT family transporter [Asticcacaulis sp. AND118]|uniref:DMT family transporter n=1 Tax=Asticcacaulis sp. AND118 TaxID=2840468 RepID=UPI001CFF8FCF|nr:DMT family transporter [Asticcacaulis sp. AND118]UDF02441.1 DMT family transporter [Asticcacaulis sp. AND118]